MSRSTMVLLMVGGFALQAVSYFLLAAPLGLATNPAFSNPRLVFAPGLFLIGLMAVLAAVVLYALRPERRIQKESIRK